MIFLLLGRPPIIVLNKSLCCRCECSEEEQSERKEDGQYGSEKCEQEVQGSRQQEGHDECGSKIPGKSSKQQEGTEGGGSSCKEAVSYLKRTREIQVSFSG